MTISEVEKDMKKFYKGNEKHYLMLSLSPISKEERLICTNCHSEFMEKYFRLSVGEAQYCPVCGVKVEDNAMSGKI